MRNGKFRSMSFIEPSLLKTYKLTSAMGLEPSVGNLSSMPHNPTIAGGVKKLVEMSSKGGEITVIRVYSSFGGTSRGIADKINEILWDISRSTGIRIQIMDIVVIPGLSTSTSRFHMRYQRNTHACIMEISALRTGRFHRLIYDHDGNACGERHEFLPHTLVLVNDIQEERGVLSLEALLATVARFVELITREEVSASFLGVSSDLERHETTVPFADRVGLFSLFLPNREERISRELEITTEVLTHLIQKRGDHTALAKRLLGEIGIYAAEVEQLGVWKRIKESLYESLGMDPIERFKELYLAHPNDYFAQYEELKEAIEAGDTEEIGKDLFENILKEGVVDTQISALKRGCSPRDIQPVLNEAFSLSEQDKKELEASVYDEDPGIIPRIKDYEENASRALHFSRARPRSRKESLLEVKRHLLSALELRVKAAALRVFYTILSGFLDAIENDEIESWREIEKEAQEMVQTLTDIRDEQVSFHNSLKNGHYLYRGNSERLERLIKPRNASNVMSDGTMQRLLAGVYSVIENMYGKPPDVVKNEILSYIQRRVKMAFQSDDAHLNPKLVTQHDYTNALKCAVPLLMVDTTTHTHRRAVFCFSPSGNSREMMEKAVADTGIHVDREVLGRIRRVNDELIMMSYDKGVPLSSIRVLQDCRNQYLRDAERYKGHLEPVFELLPDPIGSNGNGERYLLMAVVIGSVRKANGGYTYLDIEDSPHSVKDISFFSDYERAVEIAGRFIVNLKKKGFASVMRQVKTAKDTAEFRDIAPELLSSLERYAAIYERGVS